MGPNCWPTRSRSRANVIANRLSRFARYCAGGDMNRTQFRRGSWQLWAMGLSAVVAAATTQSLGQTPTGAAGRLPAQQEPSPIVMSPKAKSAGWSGIHRPHTKIKDVLARHHGQADWAETIV